MHAIICELIIIQAVIIRQCLSCAKSKRDIASKGCQFRPIASIRNIIMLAMSEANKYRNSCLRYTCNMSNSCRRMLQCFQLIHEGEKDIDTVMFGHELSRNYS